MAKKLTQTLEQRDQSDRALAKLLSVPPISNLVTVERGDVVTTPVSVDWAAMAAGLPPLPPLPVAVPEVVPRGVQVVPASMNDWYFQGVDEEVAGTKIPSRREAAIIGGVMAAGFVAVGAIDFFCARKRQAKLQAMSDHIDAAPTARLKLIREVEALDALQAAGVVPASFADTERSRIQSEFAALAAREQAGRERVAGAEVKQAAALDQVRQATALSMTATGLATAGLNLQAATMAAAKPEEEVETPEQAASAADERELLQVEVAEKRSRRLRKTRAANVERVVVSPGESASAALRKIAGSDS